MATLRDTIARADDMRPNAIPEEQKARCLYAFEAEIANTMQVEPPPFEWPLEGEDAELLMPYPHDDIYLYHLCAWIDNYQQETDSFANDSAVSNAATNDALAWWRRTHTPKNTQYRRLAP